MLVSDLIKGVQVDLDDPEGTYITPDYIMGFLRKAFKKIANKLRLTDSDFQEKIVELPNVTAGTPDLSAFQKSQQPLDGMITPTMVEWKIPGQGAQFYREAEGPLDKLSDIPDPGNPQITSWTFIGGILELSKFSVNLDLRITGDFFPNLAISQTDDATTPGALPVNADVPFQTLLSLSIAKARGMDKLVLSLQADYDDELDDVQIALVKAQQGTPRRLGRMNQRVSSGGSDGIIPN